MKSANSSRPQANQTSTLTCKRSRALRFGKTLDRSIRLALCLVLLLQGMFIGAVRPVAAEVKPAVTKPAVQDNGQKLSATEARPVASAVVNFAQLAAQEASKPAQSGPPIPQVIHSPVTPPEVEPPSTAGKGQEPPPPVAAPAVVSPSPSSSFIGMTDIPTVGSGFVVIPPDTTGAVGLTKIFTTVNNNYVVQDKITGALSAAVSMDTFWTGIGATGTFDPRTLYDPFNDRWIVSAVSDSVSANSSVLVGVSQTGDPGGTYFLFRFDADATNTNWADFPCVGFNKNWVAINVNMVAQPGPAIPNKALVLDYPALRTGTVTGTFFSGTGTCAYPVTTYSSTENTLYVTTHLSSGGATYRLDTITGTPAAPAYALGATKTRTGGGWTQPLNQILPQSGPIAGTITACGAGVPCPLETQDAFVRSEPIFRNGNIYYAQTIGLPAGVLTRTAVQWTKINTSGNFVDGGRVDDPTATSSNGGKWYAYPSLAVNQRDDVMLGFSQFASNQHPSAGYTFRFGVDAAGTMQDPFIYKAGEDYYHKTFSSGRNRFGDYSKTQVDPSNDFDMWTMQEYAMLRVGTDDGNTGSNSSKWSTWWAKLSLQPTLAKIKSFNATGFDDGRVLLQWNSTFEVENLGYNVYREVAGQRTKANPQLIAGSALITGNTVALSSGKAYAWADQPQSTASARYFLEAVDLKGQSTWTGPVSVKSFTGSPAANLEQSALLTRIGLAQAQMTLGQGSTPVETRAEVAELSAAGSQIQSGLAGQASIKLAVRREGWYRVSQTELRAAGLDLKTDPKKLQLYVDGQMVPMIVNGEQNGRLDSIEFYAIGLNSPSTDAHVYWLAATTQPGTRIKAVKASGGTATSASFPYSVERKDRTLYFSALKNGEAENFFGPVVSGAGADQSLTLTSVAAGSNAANLEVSVQGVTALAHQVRVTLNGVNVGVVNFTGQSQGKASFAVSQSQLREGVNAVQLTALGGSADLSLADSVRITYQRRYIADNNALRLSASGGQQVTIGGFSSTAIRVMDVTEANNAQELTGAVLGGKASGSITITVPGTGSRTLCAFAAERTLSVTPKANTPSNLRGGGQAADYIMITTQELAASLNPLKALRESQGLAVVVVNVEDIYDEFSYGNKNPQAVKDFLALANSSWGRPLRFVLLGGDASYDPKNYLGYGDSDLVPTKLYDSAYMEAASDDHFVDFDGNNVPDVAVGRLPVRNATEMAAMVGKIVRYESSAGSNSVLLTSDIGDGYGFSTVNSVLRGLVPTGIGVNEVNRGSADDSAVRSQILAAINAGQKIVNYNGHGSVGLWRGNILTSSDAAAMTNNQKLTVFVMMTCLNGYFDDPGVESLSESVMKAVGGGAGAWASAAQCEPSGQAKMNEELYRLLFDGSGLTLGEATAKAKAGVSDVDVKKSWIYFGDPAMKLK